MTYAINNGTKLWYEVQGDGEPIVLTGGFGILHQQFHKVTPLLAAKYKVLNWNWRGAGASDRTYTQPFTIEGWVDDLRAVLDDAGIERAFFWATSTGSLFAIHFAARYPHRVRALITYPYFKVTTEWRQVYRAFQVVMDTFGWDGLARILAWIGLPAERLNSQEGIEFAAWETGVLKSSVDPLAFGPTMRAYEDVDLSPELGNLADIPVLLFGGADGPLGMRTPAMETHAREFRELVPHAEVEIIEGGGGTYVPLERPDETAQAVMRYVASVAERTRVPA
jgi:pimeloyl-ACP methyl ester carboxylesterase